MGHHALYPQAWHLEGPEVSAVQMKDRMAGRVVRGQPGLEKRSVVQLSQTWKKLEQ